MSAIAPAWICKVRVMLLALISAVLIGPKDVAAQTREEAVKLARDGQTEEAIVALRKLLTETPSDSLVAFDLSVILTWISRPQEATDAFERAGTAEAPEYVLGPVIRAYRDQKRFKEAERWAREAMRRFPQDVTWVKLLGLVLADQGRAAEAIALLDPWKEKHPNDAEVHLALGYAARGAGDRLAALSSYGQALRLQPNNREATEAITRMLADQGAPFGAASLLSEAPLRLRANQAASLVRWGGSITPRDPQRRFEGTDRALAYVDQLLAEAQAAPNPDRDLIFRLRRERIVALHNRERWVEAVEAAKQLRNDGDVPPYVLQKEGEAFLALRRPEEARLAFEAVLQAEPNNREARIEHFYALVDEEKFSAAFREIDALAASEQPGERWPREKSIQPNDKWLQSRLLAAQARSFADMPAAAWQRLLPLAEAAPANAELRMVQGDFAAARGWPRRSDEEIHIAASLVPESKSVQIALAESAIRRRSWKEARGRLNALAALYPNDAAVQRAQRDLGAHDSSELLTEFSYHYEKDSTGAASGNAPGPGTEFLARLYAPALGEVWRLFGGWEYSQAKVIEGRARRHRGGAGVELAVPDLTVELAGWSNNGDINEAGASGALAWQPTDHWTFGAEGELFAADTPLRAVRNDITANSAGGSIGYAWHESRSLQIHAHWYDFSDGNRRTAGRLTFNQRIIEIPHLDVTLRPELYASENSSDQGPYFSPLSDFSAALTVDARHVLWRRFERSFGHRLALTGGSYWQENFGSGATGNVLYEQAYHCAAKLEVRYGVQFNRAIYDGDPTPSITTFIRLNLFL